MSQSGSEDEPAPPAALDAAQHLASDDHNEEHVVQGLISDLVSQVDHLLLFKSDSGTGGTLKPIEKGIQSNCFEFRDEEEDSSNACGNQSTDIGSNESAAGDKRVGLLPGFKLHLKRKMNSATPAADLNVPISSEQPLLANHQNHKRTRTVPVVGYVFSTDLIRECCHLPKVRSRAHLVHELICAYKLPSRMQIIDSVAASESDLRSFHTEDYLQYVKCVSEEKQEGEDGILDTTVTGESYGLGYDCPSFTNMYQTMRQIAGSSLSAVRSLVSGEVSIAINWCGGWHHSKADEASGYCYVNDIVICILKLLDHGYKRILYVDFDLHHGDAVEQAFEHSHKVLTVSFHKHEVGFFPGTGNVSDAGSGKGKGFSVNVPFKDGLTDDKYVMVTREVLSHVKRYYDPEFIVAQFGADGLTGDPMNSFNLTPKSLVHGVKLLMQFNVPLLLLGGGGYHHVNTAKCWTQLTAAACHTHLLNDIPDHCNFLQYGPLFELAIDPGLRKDLNSFDQLKRSVHIIQQRLSLLHQQ